jgi:hypothetical protein
MARDRPRSTMKHHAIPGRRQTMFGRNRATRAQPAPFTLPELDRLERQVVAEYNAGARSFGQLREEVRIIRRMKDELAAGG